MSRGLSRKPDRTVAIVTKFIYILGKSGILYIIIYANILVGKEKAEQNKN